MAAKIFPVLCFLLAFKQWSGTVAASTDNDISLLVVGKTGVGKSSTANTILGTKAFVSKQSTKAVTQECQIAEAEQQGRKIMMVDMPGTNAAEVSPEEDVKIATKSAYDAVTKNPDGYDAILLVVAFGSRFTQDDKRTVDYMRAIFGEEYLKVYGILVVTHGDHYDPEENGGQTFREWCSAQTGDFQELIKECGGRVILFQNKNYDENIGRLQLQQLFAEVDRLKLDHNKYTPEIFKAAQASRDRLALEQKVAFISQRIEAELDMILQDMHESAQTVEKLKRLERRVGSLIYQIQGQDGGTGLLDNVKTLAKRVLEIIILQEELQLKEKHLEERLKEQRLTELKELFMSVLELTGSLPVAIVVLAFYYMIFSK